jgi:hypothetical protein
VSTVATKEATMRPFVSWLLRRLLIAGVLASALVLFAAAPAQAAQAAQNALRRGAWDLAGHVSGAVAQPPSPHLPLVLGAIVVLAALSSTSRPWMRDD